MREKQRFHAKNKAEQAGARKLERERYRGKDLEERRVREREGEHRACGSVTEAGSTHAVDLERPAPEISFSRSSSSSSFPLVRARVVLDAARGA